jgi:hypothetical protein
MTKMDADECRKLHELTGEIVALLNADTSYDDDVYYGALLNVMEAVLIHITCIDCRKCAIEDVESKVSSMFTRAMQAPSISYSQHLH